MGSKSNKHHHHILPTKVAVTIGVTLLFLTAVTVWVAHIDLGRLNFAIAMLVASVKAFLVVFFFMGLKYDKAENGMIFLTSFIFLAIFIILTSTDIFFRGDVYVKGPLVAASSAKSKYKKPWISTPELVAHGKELFAVQCTSCHGPQGHGDGPAASALNPKPRNFTVGDGWKNGRKPTMVFKTLKEGLAPSAMASFATLPSDDRWALTHYVLTLGPQPVPADTTADFAKIDLDPSKEGGGEKEIPTISVELAMARLAVPESRAEIGAHLYHPSIDPVTPSSNGGRLYHTHCASCHGDQGKGGIKVRNLGVNPVAYLTTAGFKDYESTNSADAFSKIVTKGIPGELMPGVGHLSSSEMHELQQYVKGLPGAQR